MRPASTAEGSGEWRGNDVRPLQRRWREVRLWWCWEAEVDKMARCRGLAVSALCRDLVGGARSLRRIKSADLLDNKADAWIVRF